ncbi:MAG: sigma-54-dependent transcriptional regulator [Phycisphaerales bacterium]
MAESALRILIVDDDPIVVESLEAMLAAGGFRVTTALGAEEALEVLTAEGERFDAVVCDVVMPGVDGTEFLRRVRAEKIPAAVVMLTGYGSVESAVESLRLGAADYLTKPVVESELRLAIERAVQQKALLSENASLRRQLDGRFGLDALIGRDPRMQRVYELVEAVAPSKTTVLMSGESGTGKSMVARAIHQRSDRAGGPFVELACGSIPETLLESELFGHVKGSFTGAHTDKPGKFEAAHGGTLFLDEINSASPAMQLKLLRALQERRFEPVGSNETREVDVRVLLASNEPLERLVQDGRFRQDLYYRINVVKIELPALRDRLGDVPLLARHFLEKFSGELGKEIVGFTPEAEERLRAHAYPGNVRELQNIIERAAVLTREPTIGVEALPAHLGESSNAGGSLRLEDETWIPTPLAEALREPERRIILRALRANEWNRQQTADQLQINRTTLYKKMKSLGIEGDEEELRAG